LWFQSRVPTGMLLAPIGNPEPKRGYLSLKSPRPFRIPDQAPNTHSPQHRSMYYSGAILCGHEIQIAHITTRTHSCLKVRCCCSSETKEDADSPKAGGKGVSRFVFFEDRMRMCL